MKEQLIERFISYVKVDTQSDSDSSSCPSTPGQLVLAKQLVEEMKQLGMEEISLDEHGYIMATLPANTEEEAPTIGFLAHMDTATEVTGKDVKPRIVNNYDGEDIVLNEGNGVVLSPKQFPELSGYKGQTLITTDGTTLLGADDKAGIAEIMTAMSYLLAHPEIKHGKIRVGFTPDEEIGRGADLFDVAAFGADYAYTMDGGPLGELQFENFNAATVHVVCRGRNVHPGSAKNKMINSTRMALELQSRLPANEVPEHTEGYEGFYHLNSVTGDVEETKLTYLIRDHDRDSFERRKQTMASIAAELQSEYGEGAVEIQITDSYYNMREQIEPVMHIVDKAYKAMERLDIKPIVEPIRGGTDGSRLSYMGLPTPNIFAGGENFHGKYEYISVESMVKATQVIVELATIPSAR